tara:strand:+ start:1122 stop:1391 length:270 start_codon:yes stop_codon:yes gene_type:complete
MATVTKVMHSDPSHAWLAVKLSEIRMLGIQTQISQHSYVKGKTAYLEEDSDAPKFIRAMKLKGIDIAIKEGSQRERSPIRYFKSYTQEV